MELYLVNQTTVVWLYIDWKLLCYKTCTRNKKIENRNVILQKFYCSCFFFCWHTPIIENNFRFLSVKRLLRCDMCIVKSEIYELDSNQSLHAISYHKDEKWTTNGLKCILFLRLGIIKWILFTYLPKDINIF